MVFRMFLLLAVVAALGCAKTTNEPGESTGIGEKLDSISTLSAPDGSESKSAVIFDETTRRIHQFLLQPMSFQRSFPVLSPEQQHYVLHSGDSNYIVDLTVKGLSIFAADGTAQHRPISFQGKPVSAAFRPDLGYLIIYDNLSSVGMLKLTTSGQVQQAWVGGPLLSADATITAGDLTDSGTLIVATSDNKLFNVDVAQSLEQKKWVYTSFATTLTGISWLAPVHGQASQVFMLSKGKLSLYDLGTQSAVNEQSIPTDFFVEKLSKNYDAHVFLNNGKERRLYYVEANLVKTRSMFQNLTALLASRLQLSADTWTYVTSGLSGLGLYNNPDEVRQSRTLVSNRFSDMLAMQSRELPDRAKLKLAEKFVFALFPSELGYATRTDISSGDISTVQAFNLDYIR